jgi:hypothetical protein
VNLTLPRSGTARPAVSRRRTVAADVAIVCSASAALAHLVAAPSHYTWWPLSGVFFVALGVLQLGYGLAMLRGGLGDRFALVGIWATVAVILLYVASRTVGVPMAPAVPFHGGRWVPGRSVVPDGAKYVGPLDVFTLVAELVLVITLIGMLSTRSRARTVNELLWVGLMLWGAGLVALFR